MLDAVRTSAIRAIAVLAILGTVTVGMVRTATTAGSGNSVRAVKAVAENETGRRSFSRPHSYLFQTPVQEKTVEQVQKNIQVLQGLPQSQLIPVMNFMASSLGVRCTFCHVNKEGNWDFAADEKPEKNTAREMIKMVQNINKTTFRGATEVSCFTCHRGRTHPVSVPPLPMPEQARPAGAPAAPGASPAPSPVATPAMPTADQVLAKYQEALGGVAVIDKLKTRTMKGTWLTSNGVSWGYEVIQSAPDKTFMMVNTPRQGIFERGYNGSVGWEQSARGLRDITGDELVFLRRYPGLFGDVKLKEQFTSLTFAGKDKINDRDVYVLRGTNTANKRERLYFDAQTGLLLRRIVFTPTPIGVIPEQVDFEDYRDVDGMKVPFTIRVSGVDPNWSSLRQFTEIKLNVPVDETKFNKPAPKPAASPSASP
ncbi:MAG: c-type cytochrome [Acidobacteriota bacterium]|nr:c-type cytochrome [Acidobacteriota bacterium]